jgi:lysyl-tRNA synthetase, class II
MNEERFREREVLKSRRDSLERLRAKGIEPFALNLQAALGVPAPDLAEDVRLEFGSRPPDEVGRERRTVAGRIVLRRDLGKLMFLVLRDGSGDIQLVCERASMKPPGSDLLDEIDLGDIVAAGGSVGKTKKGELSIFVDALAMLTKALRPLPEKWHGLRDPDLQQRLRYLQLATDPTARHMLVDARAKTLRAIRSYLDERGFVEVETPVLQPVAGGAMARPFVTHHRVLDVDLYLRISLELYLKRLLVGGLERVYEIGHNFRNEGIDRTHNPEFTMLEVYQAYGDYETMMDLSRELIRRCALAVVGTLDVPFRGMTLHLGGPWERTTLMDAVSKEVGERVELDRPDLGALARSRGVGVDPAWPPGKIVLEMYEKVVEPTLVQPTFVCDFPREVSPLARPHRSDARLTEHVDPIIGGVEIGTAYSELTDPDEQRAKFVFQQEARKGGAEETHPFDEDFLVALEHGLPPAGGLGVGIDRLLMILTDAPSIRDTILFPHLRPEPGPSP